MSAFSTFTYAKKYFVSPEIEFVTEPDPEFGEPYKPPQDLINLLADNIVVYDKVGIGSIIPQQKLDVAGSVKIDSQIYDSLNSYFSDSPDITIGVFNSLGSKLKVAQVCEKFYVIYKRDILEYLKNGNKTFDFGTGGLSNEDYNRILTIVSNKPKF